MGGGIKTERSGRGGNWNREGGERRRKRVRRGRREKEGGRGTRCREDRSCGGGGHIGVLVEFLRCPGLLGNWCWSRANSRGDREEMGRRGMRGRRGSEGKDGRLEVLDSVGIGTRVGNRMGKDGQNLGPPGRAKLIERRTGDWSGGGRRRNGVGRGRQGGGRRKKTRGSG